MSDLRPSPARDDTRDRRGRIFVPAGTVADSGQWIAIIASIFVAGFLLVDPLVLGLVRQFDDATRHVFRGVTDLGKSGWILVPAGLAAVGLHLFRRREHRPRRSAVAGLLLQAVLFLFTAVAATGIASSLLKNILGRARPKFFEQVGSFEFEPFSFVYDFASFPSGHATTVFTLAASLAIFWPKARILLFTAAAWIAATRFLIGSHYLTDVVAGAFLGLYGPYLLRDRLAARRLLFESRGGKTCLRAPRLRGWLAARVQDGFWLHSDTMAQSGKGQL